MDYSKFEGHTPGPWFAKINRSVIFIENDTGYSIADLSPLLSEDIEEQTANALLAASAPDLLEENKRLRKALELCRDVLSNTPSAYYENSKLHDIFDMLCDLNEQK